MSFLKLCFFSAFVFLLGSCSKQEERSPSKVRLLLDWLANPNHIPLFVGAEKGFFKEEGIDLEILHLTDPPSAIPYLQSKQVEVVLYYTPYTLLAAAKEEDLEILATLIDEPLDGVLYLPKQSSMNFAMPSGPYKKLIPTLLQEKGFIFEETKTFELDPIFSLMTGLVDAISGVYWNIEPIQLSFLGRESCFLKVTDLGFPSYPELIALSRKEVLKMHPNLKNGFRKALQKSIDFCRENPAKAFELYLERFPLKKEEAFTWEAQSWQATLPLFAKKQTGHKEPFLPMAHWMIEKGLLETIPPILKDIEEANDLY